MASQSEPTPQLGDLRIDHLPKLQNILDQVAYKCHNIGLQLGVRESDINNIKHDFSKCRVQLREILSHRLKQMPALNMSDIVASLRSDSVQENRLATEIEQNLIPALNTSLDVASLKPESVQENQLANRIEQISNNVASVISDTLQENRQANEIEQNLMPAFNTNDKVASLRLDSVRENQLANGIEKMPALTMSDSVASLRLRNSDLPPGFLITQRFSIAMDDNPFESILSFQLANRLGFSPLPLQPHTTSQQHARKNNSTIFKQPMSFSQPSTSGVSCSSNWSSTSQTSTVPCAPAAPLLQADYSTLHPVVKLPPTQAPVQYLLPPLSLDDAMNTFIQYLKTTYRRSTVENNPAVIKWPPTPSKVYINLACISYKGCNTQSKYDETTNMMIKDGNVDIILKEKTAIQFEDIDKYLPSATDNTDSRVVLVEGAPGVGKSTFAWEFCRRWERGEIARQYQLVLLLRLRDERMGRAQGLSDLLYHPLDSVRVAVETKIAMEMGSKTLIILEGYDELGRELSVFKELINGKCLPLATILITSRPWATRFLHRNPRELFKCIEILGFRQEQIEEYIKTTVEKEDIEKLVSYLRTYPQIKACMYIPLNSAIVVSVYNENVARKCALPRTLTELYDALLRTLLLRYLHGHSEYCKQSWSLRSLEHDLPKEVHKKLLYICQLAYCGLFPVDMYGQPTALQLIFSNLPQEFDTLGLMQSVPQLYVAQGETMSYNFLHLTVQEFLAAMHISQMPVLMGIWTRVKTLNYDVVLRFLAGLTKLRDIPLDILEIQKQNGSTVNIYQPPYHIDVAVNEKINLLFETQSRNIVRSFLGERSIVLFSGRKLQYFDYYALGYCIVHSHSDWVLELGGIVSEDEVAMLVAGANTNTENSCWRIISLRGPPNTGLFHSSCAGLNALFRMSGIENLQQINMDMECHQCAAIQWPNFNNLRVLCIHNNSCSDNCSLKALPPIPTLEIFAENGACFVGTEHCEAIAQLLKSSVSLKSVTIDKMTSENTSLESLADALMSHSDTLEYLQVRTGSYLVSDMVLNALTSLINTSSTLRHFCIEGVTFTATGLLAVVNALYKPAIKEFKLFHLYCTVDDDSSIAFLDLCIQYPLIMKTCLKSKNIDNQDNLSTHIYFQNISATGAKAIAAALTHSLPLSYLNFVSSSIGDNGMAAIAEALYHNSTLTKLILNDNNIGDAGAIALADCLPYNHSLTHLELTHNNITSIGARALANGLSPRSTLRCLNLYGNEDIDREAAFQLLHWQISKVWKSRQCREWNYFTQTNLILPQSCAEYQRDFWFLHSESIMK